MLPNELLIKIIEEAGEVPAASDSSHDVFPSIDSLTLSNLSLVNRRFRPLAQEALFRYTSFSKVRFDLADWYRMDSSALYDACAHIRHIRFAAAAAHRYFKLTRLLNPLFASHSQDLQSLTFVGYQSRAERERNGLVKGETVEAMMKHFGRPLSNHAFASLERVRFANMKVQSIQSFVVADPRKQTDTYKENMRRVKEWDISDRFYLEQFYYRLYQRNHVTFNRTKLTLSVLNHILALGDASRIKWDALTRDHMSLNFASFTSLNTLHLSRMSLDRCLLGGIKANQGLEDVDLRVVWLWDPPLEQPWAAILSELRRLPRLRKLSLHELGYGDPVEEPCTFLTGLESHNHARTLHTGHRLDEVELEGLWRDLERRKDVEIYPRTWTDIKVFGWGDEWQNEL